MAKLPSPVNRTAAAIYARHERSAEDWRRVHLGASAVGSSCTRELWYSFRWALNPRHEGRLLRLFERGHREEAWIVAELRLVGMSVEELDLSVPLTVEEKQLPQYRFKALGGHFAGGSDGFVLGVFEAPKSWHLLEVKTSNERRFKELQRDGVRTAQPKHWEQMQSYMHGMAPSLPLDGSRVVTAKVRVRRALYVCVCKNDDHVYVERIHYDRAAAEAIARKAEGVIFAPEPLSRISEDPTWFECKFCDYRPVCHLGQVELLERNCRTCLSSTPTQDGAWTCDYYKDGALGEKLTLVPNAQRHGCEDHLFIPSLLPWKTTNVDEERRTITYAKPDGTSVVDVKSKLVEVP